MSQEYSGAPYPVNLLVVRLTESRFACPLEPVTGSSVAPRRGPERERGQRT